MPWTSNQASICSSSGRLQDVSWRRLQNIFSVTYFYLPKCLQDVLKASCKYVLKTSLRHFPRRLEEVNIKIWPRVNTTNLLISYTKYLSSKTNLRKKDIKLTAIVKLNNHHGIDFTSCTIKIPTIYPPKLWSSLIIKMGKRIWKVPLTIASRKQPTNTCISSHCWSSYPRCFESLRNKGETWKEALRNVDKYLCQ